MSTFSSLGVKNILDSGGFLRDVQEYLRSKFPHKRYVKNVPYKLVIQDNVHRLYKQFSTEGFLYIWTWRADVALHQSVLY